MLHFSISLDFIVHDIRSYLNFFVIYSLTVLNKKKYCKKMSHPLTKIFFHILFWPDCWKIKKVFSRIALYMFHKLFSNVTTKANSWYTYTYTHIRTMYICAHIHSNDKWNNKSTGCRSWSEARAQTHWLTCDTGGVHRVGYMKWGARRAPINIFTTCDKRVNWNGFGFHAYTHNTHIPSSYV